MDMKKICPKPAAKVALGTSSRDLQEVLRGFPCTFMDFLNIRNKRNTKRIPNTSANKFCVGYCSISNLQLNINIGGSVPSLKTILGDD